MICNYLSQNQSHLKSHHFTCEHTRYMKVNDIKENSIVTLQKYL